MTTGWRLSRNIMPTWRLVFTCHTKYNVVKRPRARSVGWRPCNLRFDLIYIVLHISRHIWFTIYCIAYGRATSVFSYTNIKLKRVWVHGMIWTLENTEGAIKTRQSREAGNIEYTRRRKTQRSWQHRVHKTKKNTETLAT